MVDMILFLAVEVPVLDVVMCGSVAKEDTFIVVWISGSIAFASFLGSDVAFEGEEVVKGGNLLSVGLEGDLSMLECHVQL
jgi:hypothetical protein